MPERNPVTGKRMRCLFCLPTLICHQSLIITAAILLLSTQVLGAQRHYYMDNKLDCSMQGFIDVPSRESITVSLKSNPPIEFPGHCTLKFRAENNREFIKVVYSRFFIDKCSVKVSTNDNSFSCGQVPPSEVLLDLRKFTLSLVKDPGDHEYNGDIIITTYIKDYSVTNQDEVSNPTLIGIIIGVVCGIIFIIVVIAIVGHCYYKSLKRRQTRNACLDDNDQPSIGYINDGVKNGIIIKNNNSPKNNGRSLLSHDTEVKQFYDCVEENKKHTIPNSLANNSKKSVDVDNGSDKTRQQNPTPKSPVLSALHNSPKFQASFKSTDAEAEERSKRFSQGSTLPPTPPPLPTVPTSPHMQSSQTNTNHAGIRRVPKISASSEDMEHLEREINIIELENQKTNHILPSNSNVAVSSTKNVPVTTNLQPQSSVEQPTLVQPSSKDNSNQHTLRPTRVQDKKKQGDITDGQPMPSRPQKTYKEKDSSINSLRKHGHKIPKSTKGRALLSDGENNFTSDDQAQRSDTPLSELSSRMTRTDDNESLPPLQRTTSRQSLFASRTSLYARRGKRERRSSISDSVTTYAHDDIDMYISSDPDPMDRRDARAFKSLVDITKTSKDGSCQDQTKKISAKKNAYKKSARKSSSSTQTIEQKGTQTESSQKKTSQNKEEIIANSNAIWGKSSPNIKGDVVNPVQPNEMAKSQFQPITKATDMESSALGNQYLNNVPTSPEGEELTKPTKSPWELLCELTDTEMKMKDSRLPSGNELYNSDFPSTNVDGQSRPSVDNIPSVYHPSISSQVSDKESYAPAYSPATVPNYSPSVTSNLSNKLYPRKSSWEALKELTDAQLSYPLKGTSESIV